MSRKVGMETPGLTRTPPAWLEPWLDVPEDLPEPAPISAGEDVTPSLLKWITTLSPLPWLNIYRMIGVRAAFGWRKYHTTLKTGDGRGIKDILDEDADALHYQHREKMKGVDMSPVIPLLLVRVAHLLDSLPEDGRRRLQNGLKQLIR